MMAGPDPFDFEGASRQPRPAVPSSPYGSGPPPVGPVAAGPPGGVPEFARARRGAVGPPVGWLVAALVVAAGAAVVALLLGTDVPVAFLCWVLAGPGAIGLISVFVLRDTRARSLPLYIRPPWIGALYAVAVLAVVAGIGASAWRIADWWGRL